MTRYLVQIEVEEMDLAIPVEHVEGLLDYFDGRHPGERSVAQAILRGPELAFESRGGRMTFERSGNALRARELDLMDDRSGEFFERVVANLFCAYRGTLRCRVRWAGQGGRGSEEWVDVAIERGKSTWPAGPSGVWLDRPAAGGDADEKLEEILAKLEEAERHYAEYQRLKGQRELSKR